MFQKTVALVTALLLIIIAVCSCDDLASFVDDDPNVIASDRDTDKEDSSKESSDSTNSETELGGKAPLDSSVDMPADTRNPSHGVGTDTPNDTDVSAPPEVSVPFDSSISKYRVISVNDFEINASVDGKAQARRGRVVAIMNDKDVPTVYLDILTADGTAVECHKLFGGYCKVLMNDSQILVCQSVINSSGIVNVNIGKHFVSNMSERGEITDDGKLNFFTITGEREGQKVYVTQPENISKMYVRMLISVMEELLPDMKYLIADTVNGTDTYEKGLLSKAGSPEEYINFDVYKSLYGKQNGNVEYAEDTNASA